MSMSDGTEWIKVRRKSSELFFRLRDLDRDIPRLEAQLGQLKHEHELLAAQHNRVNDAMLTIRLMMGDDA